MSPAPGAPEQVSIIAVRIGAVRESRARSGNQSRL